MDRNTVLIPVDVECDETTLKSLILGIPEQGVHASFLVLGTPEPLPSFAYASAPYGTIVLPDHWQESFQTAGKAVSDKANGVELLLQKADIEGDVTSAFCETPLLDGVVSEHATFSDIVFLPESLTDKDRIFQQVLHGALFRSVSGVVLNSKSLDAVLNARNAFVAWDASLPAVRAVHRALPILKQAETVTIAVFDPLMRESADGENPGSALATWLSRHDCNVIVQQYPSGGKEIGESIIERASETGGDLIIMGAYAHSRARQRLLGGTTRTLIEQQDQAIFLAH